jgi:hypothetical protein
MITDLDARRIASEWHGGGGSALYAFASTGAIDTAYWSHSITDEIWRCLRNDVESRSLEEQIPALRDLTALLAYVDHHAERGPVAGWGKLTW